MRKVLSGFVVIVTVLGLAACGDDDDDDSGAVATSAGGAVTTAAPGGEPTNTITITVSGNAFDPATAEAALAAGTYAWHCKIHSSMTGTLTVT